MNKSHRRWKMSALAVLAAAAAPAVRAQSTRVWTGAGSDALWTDLTNWGDNPFPGTGDTANFIDAGSGNTNISLGGGVQPINTILFSGSPASYNLGVTTGDVFSFDGGGAITLNPEVTAAQTISAGIQTNGGLTISNSVSSGATSGAGLVGLTLGNIAMNSGGTLTIINPISNVVTQINGNITDTAGAPGSLSLVATGTAGGNNNNFVLTGNNTYSGGTSINVNTGNQGSIQLGTDSPFGTGRVTMTLVTGTSSPQFQALNGTRTIANAFDLGSGMTYIGSNSFVFTGPMNVVGGTRTLNNLMTSGASVTFGASASSPSTITLGNPVSNGGDGVARSLTFNLATGATTTINDVIQDVAPGVSGSVSYTGGSTNGTALLQINSPNTYSGPTTLSVGAAIIPITFSSNGSTGASTSGPFGTGTLIFNNTNNSRMRPIGAQTLSNPVTFSFGMLLESSTALDTSSLTLSGPLALAAAGRTFSNGQTNNTSVNGASLILGSAAAPSTFTLPTFGTSAQNVVFAAVTGPIIINDVIQDPTGTGGTNTISLNPNNGNVNAIVLNGANTYQGNTTLGGSTTGSGIIQIGVSSVVNGTSVVSGAFGKGTITFNNSGTPPNIQPVGADRTVANNVTIANSGFMVSNSGTTSFNLTFSGPINETVNRTLTNIMNPAAAFIVGDPAAPSTWTLSNAQIGIQSQSGNVSRTVINDLIQNGTGTNKGTLLVQNKAFVQLTNPNNTYTGGTVINGGQVTVAADGNLGAATSAVTISTGTLSSTGLLLSTGTFSSIRPVNLNGITGTNTIDVTAGNAVTLNGLVAGNGNLTKGTNAGTLALTNTNTYANGTTINGGAVSVAADGNLGNATGVVNINSATLLSTGAFTSARTINLNAADSTLDSTSGNSMVLTGVLGGTGNLNKGTNLGTVQLAQATGYTNAANVNVNGGALVVGDATGAATGPLAVGGTLTVANSAKVALSPSTTGVGTNSGVVHSINNLNLNNTGILDLGNTAMTVGSATPTSTVRQYLINGYSNGNWNGTSGGGITSTWAANDASKRTAVGYNAQPDGSTLVAATLYGDTNLKGSVGLSDYNTLAANFNKPGEWAQGDFDYNGTVGLSDYNLLAANFNKSAQPGGGVAAAGAGGAGGAAKPAAATLTGSADPAGQTTKPNGVVDPGAGNVLLEADPTTGKVYIVGHDSNINSYEVDSAAGKLTFVSGKNPGGYNTLTAQSTVDFIPGSNNPSEGTWAVLSSQSGTFVAEVYPASASPAFDIIGPGLQVFDLNKSGLSAWTAGTPISDLTFKYGNGTGATLTPAVVDLSAGGVPEPTCLALAGIAAGGLLNRKRRKAM